MSEQKSNRTLTLLERWKQHPTRRAELAALLQEPALQDALAIMREQTFKPQPTPVGVPDIIAFTALRASVREGYLEMLANFLALANISPFRAPTKKPWDTADRDAAIAKMSLEEFGSAPEPVATQPAPPTPVVSTQPET